MSPLPRVLLVWDRIGDYHAARFLELEKYLGRGRVTLADLGASDKLYGWKNPLDGHPAYVCLSRKPVEESDTWNRFRAFVRLAETHQADVLGIAGYGRAEYNLMLLYARLRGKKVVLFAESWYGENRWLNRLKGLWLRFTCHAFMVSGQRAKHHFEDRLHLKGMPSGIGYSAVDNAHFASAGLSKANPELLCVARFSPEKNLERLVRCFSASDLNGKWTLRLVGGGPLAGQLEKQAAGNPSIVFSPWTAYDRLPALFSGAGFFILPSLFEPWGLVVNEAMSAGLPVALSTACGCLPELMGDENGFSFNPESDEALLDVLNRIARLSTAEIQAMGRGSLNRVGPFSSARWAVRFSALAGLSPDGVREASAGESGSGSLPESAG